MKFTTKAVFLLISCSYIYLIGECLYFFSNNNEITKEWFLQQLCYSLLFSFIIGGGLLLIEYLKNKSESKELEA